MTKLRQFYSFVSNEYLFNYLISKVPDSDSAQLNMDTIKKKFENGDYSADGKTFEADMNLLISGDLASEGVEKIIQKLCQDKWNKIKKKCEDGYWMEKCLCLTNKLHQNLEQVKSSEIFQKLTSIVVDSIQNPSDSHGLREDPAFSFGKKDLNLTVFVAALYSPVLLPVPPPPLPAWFGVVPQPPLPKLTNDDVFLILIRHVIGVYHPNFNQNTGILPNLNLQQYSTVLQSIVELNYDSAMTAFCGHFHLPLPLIRVSASPPQGRAFDLNVINGLVQIMQ